MPSRQKMVRAPLLDRLTDSHPRQKVEPVPRRDMTPEEYRTAVFRDILRLLESRSAYPERFVEGKELTVIDYGLPDVGGLFADSVEDLRHFEQSIRTALSAFEPRLENPVVEARIVDSSKPALRLDAPPTRRPRIHLVVGGTLCAGRMKYPVSFPIVYNADDDSFRDAGSHTDNAQRHTTTTSDGDHE